MTKIVDAIITYVKNRAFEVIKGKQKVKTDLTSK